MVDYSSYSTLSITKADRIATVTLNRPQFLNAINGQMVRELTTIWADLMSDDEVDVVVLTGAGKCFSAGGDIKNMQADLAGGENFATFEIARRQLMNMTAMEKPVVAALNGDAIGEASNIALFSDIIIAAEDARLGDPHVKVAFAPSGAGVAIWPLVAGIAKAKEILLTGDLIGAKDAERLGIINYAVPRERVLPMAMEYAHRLVKGPTLAIRWTNVCINKQLKERVNLVGDASIGIEMAVTHPSEDHREAVQAFVEKRKPHFKGK